ncbi:hypothetical protein DPMN_006835 [Dreissena polymorpha]|uniref:Uncharacterized protein n=1 Tax=Dreissena polymorpha TaxID=45954 RepID=A0A9D4MW49_DREPO|nr:hypothetical protein DPMN_006835 [Dreissena polymorpha]
MSAISALSAEAANYVEAIMTSQPVVNSVGADISFGKGTSRRRKRHLSLPELADSISPKKWCSGNNASGRILAQARRSLYGSTPVSKTHKVQSGSGVGTDDTPVTSAVSLTSASSTRSTSSVTSVNDTPVTSAASMTSSPSTTFSVASSASVNVTLASSVTYATSTSVSSMIATSAIGGGDQLGASVMEMLKNISGDLKSIHSRMNQFESSVNTQQKVLGDRIDQLETRLE